ncbi:MAG TPA: HAD-IIIC family phosphatase [Steroidobacteraceae bacterium]|nr:HAD-IIIC family phosphatase [Steroidobacteraceae bacterium]
MLEHLRSLNRSEIGHAEIRRLVGRLRSKDHSPQVRIAFAGNVVTEPLPDYLLVHLACDGISASTCSVPFDQLIPELLDPQSGLRQFDPGFLHLHFEIEPLLHGRRDRREFETEEHRRAAFDDVVSFANSMVSAALKHTHAIVLLSNFVGPDSYGLGLADFRSDYGEQQFFAEVNIALAKIARSDPRVQIVDLALLSAHHGSRNSRDRRLYYMSKIPWQESFFSPLAAQLARHVKASLGHVRKCLVVDFDNTLWSGVLGEEGPLGVRVGIGDPRGEAHLDLQRSILALKRRGILLAACSKNNLADVEELFRLRPEMPLRLSDFACMEIGWNSKDQGLRRIASHLNIGTDSLVFLDDNPAEIELIRQLLPETECVLLPPESTRIATCLDALHGLDRTVITAEDVAKDRQYADANARKALRDDFTDLRDYLRNLDTLVVLKRANRDLLPRAHQLFTKTNQFNVSGRRYSPGELEQASNDPDSYLLMVHAQDKFGDLGWIGAALLRAEASSSHCIENLVISCRALGRGLEIPIINRMRQIAFDERGGASLTAKFCPSSKNGQVASLFESHGFDTARVEADNSRHYVLHRHSSHAPAVCDWIKVTLDDDAAPVVHPMSRSSQPVLEAGAI